MLDEAQKLIDEGKIEESTAKMKEVENLDNKWEETKLANANMEALKGNTKIVDLVDKSVNLNGGKIVDSTIEKAIDNKANYETAWAKYMQGGKLEGSDLEVFNKTNKGI